MHIKKLLFSLALCLGAGGIGSYFTMSSIGTWYALLQKPVFTPPNWVFGPVWTLLYIMMGIALYCVWKKRDTKYKSKVAAYTWFYMQLILNVMWSAVFFWVTFYIRRTFNYCCFMVSNCGDNPKV